MSAISGDLSPNINLLDLASNREFFSAEKAAVRIAFANPNFRRDIHRVPITGGFIDSIRIVLKESEDDILINKLLQEIFSDPSLRSEVLRDRAIRFEMEILFRQNRLTENVIQLFLDNGVFPADSGLHIEALERIGEHDFDLLSLLSHPDEAVRYKAKQDFLRAVATEENGRTLESFVEEIVGIFELKAGSFDETDSNFEAHRFERDSVEMILEDKELKKLFIETLSASWFNDDKSINYPALIDDDSYPDDMNLPEMKDPSMIDLFVTHFGAYLDTIFMKNPPKPDFDSKDFLDYCGLILGNLSLLRSVPNLRIHLKEYLNSISSEFLIEWIHEDDQNTELLKNFISVWGEEVPADQLKIVLKALEE